MAEKKAEKCAHPACSCSVKNRGWYCSHYCESVSINSLGTPCNCGHGECAAGETAAAAG